MVHYIANLKLGELHSQTNIFSHLY